MLKDQRCTFAKIYADTGGRDVLTKLVKVRVFGSGGGGLKKKKKTELLCSCASHSLNSPVSDYSSCVSGVNEHSVVHTILTASLHTKHLYTGFFSPLSLH